MNFLVDADVFKDVLSWNFTSEVIMSLIVMGIIAILCIIIFIQCKKTPTMESSKGLLSLFEIAVEKIQGLVIDLMGPAFSNSLVENFVATCFLFIPCCFLIGVMGFSCPVSSLTVTLSLALISFVLIHATSVKYTKHQYFKRYIDPFPAFLPINLISMWSPLLSLSLRLFGNGLSGYVLMTLIYGVLNKGGSFITVEGVSSIVDGAYGAILYAPIVTPILHAYFDLFSGAIQTIVFTFLSMLLIAQEKPEEEVPSEIRRTSDRDMKLKEA